MRDMEGMGGEARALFGVAVPWGGGALVGGPASGGVGLAMSGTRARHMGRARLTVRRTRERDTEWDLRAHAKLSRRHASVSPIVRCRLGEIASRRVEEEEVGATAAS